MRIISGGQTGADRGGLDAAITLGLEHGGWCPKGRRAEDGKIPEHYLLVETGSPDYLKRTELNVRDADATLIFIDHLPLSGGSKRTVEFCKARDKPGLVVITNPEKRTFNARSIERFFQYFKPTTLNIAGCRESKAPGIQREVRNLLVRVLRQAVEAMKRSPL